MRRVVCTELGSLDNLVVEEVDPLVPAAHQVVIDVEAAGATYVDALMAKGGYQIKPPTPFCPGGEVAGPGLRPRRRRGRVRPRRPGAGRLRHGRVRRAGGAARHQPRPPARGPDGAGGGHARPVLRHDGLRLHPPHPHPAGRVGARARGPAGHRPGGDRRGPRARASRRSRRRRARRSWRPPSGPAPTRRSTTASTTCASGCGRPDRGVDIVVDPVGAPYAEPALRSLRPSGRYLVIGFTGGQVPRMPANHVLLNNRAVVGVDWGAWSTARARGQQGDRGRGRGHGRRRAACTRPSPRPAPSPRRASALQAFLDRRVVAEGQRRSSPAA